jgi:hypothetical protein
MKCVERILIGSGAAYNMELGFEPHRVEVELVDAATASIFYHWNGRAQQEHTTCVTDSTEYGTKVTEGVTSICDTVAKGISLYAGSKTQRVLVESPKPGVGDIATDITGDWTTAISTAATARSATAIGTIVRPTTHNGYVYECTTAGIGAATEPTWPTTPGETVTDGTTVWTCREENIVAGKGKGITLGATLLTSGALFFVRAFMYDDVVDLGTPT